MRNIYRKLIKLLENNILRIHIFKTWIFEWISIFKKSNQYKDIVWSSEQQKKFDKFWLENYGRKISNRWHKLYQSANGVFDEKYFPEIIYTTKLELKLNNFKLSKILEDKSLVEILYGSIKEIEFPRTISLNCSGIYYDNNRDLINKEEMMNLLYNSGEIVIKPIIDSSSGEGVKVLDIKDGINIENNLNLQDILKEYQENFIVQERLKQNETFNKLYSESINTIRIVTYILNDEVYHMPITIRVGANGQKVDNIHAGGIGIGVSDTGELKKIGYDNYNKTYTQHPNTGIVFENYKVPFMQEIINAAYKAHCNTPHIGIVSWDFMVNQNNQIVLIEANIIGQGSWFPQILNACGPFEDNTKDILKLIS